MDRSLQGFLILVIVFSSITVIPSIGPVSVRGASERMIYIYFDDRYPNSWLGDDSTTLLGYLVNIFIELGINHLVVDADGLRQVVLDENPQESIVIFTQDVFPDTVWNGSSSALIVEWMKAGGALVWTGDWEFYYIGFRNGTKTHLEGIQHLPFGRHITVPKEGNVSCCPEWGDYLPYPAEFTTQRPFSELLLQGMYYEAYGRGITESDIIVDPGLVRVGDGFFLKMGATGTGLEANVRAMLVAGLTLIRFNLYDFTPITGLDSFQSQDSGIVYILPQGASSYHWMNTYGDRIYFYAHANLTDYKGDMLDDFEAIARNYRYAIVTIPLSDTELFYYNMERLNQWAEENKLEILYAFFSMYGGGETYFDIGSQEHALLVQNMGFLTNLSSTTACGVWYGDHERPMNVSEIRDLYYSLPQELREKYHPWVDQPFIEEAVMGGLPSLANELNLTVVTELYSHDNLALYGGWFEDQIIVTGYSGAPSPEDWVSGMRGKLGSTLQVKPEYNPRRLGVWIFWDENDGSNEDFAAYINGSIRNPLQPSAQLKDFHEAFTQNRVNVIYPSDGTDKPLGTGRAMLSDWQSSAYVTTKLNNYTEGLDTEPTFLDQSTAEPVAPPQQGIISFGGPLVNPLVKRAESTGTPPPDRAPIKYRKENGTLYFQKADGTPIMGANLPESEINTNKDIFLIESYRDGKERPTMICYGFSWKGTYAAGKYFHSKIYPEIATNPNTWIIVKWEDTNETGFVNGPYDGDNYTIIAQS
jgi:hypothetical protein